MAVDYNGAGCGKSKRLGGYLLKVVGVSRPCRMVAQSGPHGPEVAGVGSLSTVQLGSRPGILSQMLTDSSVRSRGAE